MKGALVKEFNLLKSHRMWLLIAFASISLLSVIVSKVAIIPVALIIIALTAPIKYANYDERYGWDDFSKSLPLSKAEIVGARYIVCFAEALLALLLMSVCQKIAQFGGGSFSATDLSIVSQTVNRFAVVSLAVSAMIKLGFSKKGRTKRNISILICIGCSIAVCFIRGIEEKLGLTQLYALEKWLPVAVVLVSVALVILSYFLTIGKKQKKADKEDEISKKAIAIISAVIVGVSCVSLIVLKVNERLVLEKQTDYEAFHDSVIYPPSNSQNANRTEVFEALKVISGKTFIGTNVNTVLELFENSEHTFLVNKLGRKEKTIVDNYSQNIVQINHSEDGIVISMTVKKDVGAGYMKTPESISIEDKFVEGMSEAEFIAQLEKSEIPIYSMEEQSTTFGDVYRTYKSLCFAWDEDYETYVAYNIVADVREGKLNAFNVAKTFLVTEDENSFMIPVDVNPDMSMDDSSSEYYDELNVSMIELAKKYCGQKVVGRDAVSLSVELLESGFIGSGEMGYYYKGVRVSLLPDIMTGKVIGFIWEVEANSKFIASATSENLDELASVFYEGMPENELISELERFELHPKKIAETVLDSVDISAGSKKTYISDIYVDKYNDGSYYYGSLTIDVQDNKVVNAVLSEY